LFCRPYAHQLRLPDNVFLWKGFDGSTVKACRTATYNSPLGGAVKTILERAKDDHPTLPILWGVGNHGGGPSHKDLCDIETLQAEKDGEYEFVHSTPEAFFEEVSPKTVFEESLRPSNIGCYTSMNRVKQKHIKLENELYLTEKMLSVASLKGLLTYPQEELTRIAEDLMNAEFHDVLPGSSIRAGEENGVKLLDRGILSAEQLRARAFFALSSAEPSAKEGEYPILVFNPQPYPLTTEVECEFNLADQNWNSAETTVMTVFDRNGNELPIQVIKEKCNLNLDWRKRIMFTCTLAPLEVSRFSVYTKRVPVTPKEKKEIYSFSVGGFDVTLDEKTGLLSVWQNGKQYVASAFQPVLYEDNPDPWAMGDFQLHKWQGKETPMHLSSAPYGIFKGMKPIGMIEDGELFTAFEAYFEGGSSQVRMEYRIFKNRPVVDVNAHVFYADPDTILRLRI
ncbi:MAG: hypothetical protein MJ078_07215, partial [Clostridia bacterium]|nr:hypothetical protein [Clostridia bacterium]